jgi:hypothetical protein
LARYLVPDPAPGNTEFLQRVEAEALDRFTGLGATSRRLMSGITAAISPA